MKIYVHIIVFVLVNYIGCSWSGSEPSKMKIDSNSAKKLKFYLKFNLINKFDKRVIIINKINLLDEKQVFEKKILDNQTSDETVFDFPAANSIEYLAFSDGLPFTIKNSEESQKFIELDYLITENPNLKFSPYYISCNFARQVNMFEQTPQDLHFIIGGYVGVSAHHTTLYIPIEPEIFNKSKMLLNLIVKIDQD